MSSVAEPGPDEERKRIKRETQRSSVAAPRLEEEPKRIREKHKGHLSSVAAPR